MSGRLIISLDFELMWGVRDHRSIAEYGDAVLGAREAIPRMLSLFEAYGIRATWATVGFLFARNRAELFDHAPVIRPDYVSERASPYAFAECGLGHDERDDPWHFGRSLVERIGDTPGQEIATHSFSHFCCLEPGHSREAFAADIAAAFSIMESAGHVPRSMVFARNQYDTESARTAAAAGIKVFRGNPGGFVAKPRPRSEKSLPIRAMQLAEDVFPFAGRNRALDANALGGLVNVHANRFLRPSIGKYALLSRMHLRKVRAEMRRAAAEGDAFHLWWHPHNFGRNTESGLRQLEDICREYRALNSAFGFASVTMVEEASTREG